MKKIFNFEFKPIEEPLRLKKRELLSQTRWDNLFYQGVFPEREFINIRCITPCYNCYLSWFNIPLTDFEKNKLSDLVKKKFLSHDTIREKGLAEIKKIGNSFSYKTTSGGSGNYAQVQCKNCYAQYLLVLSLTEIQPMRYIGQLQGIWSVEL